MKITCLRFLMVAFMMGLMTTVSIGQDFALIENEGTPGPLPCNNDQYFITIKVANLDLLNNSSGNTLPLPTGYPDLYVHFDVGNSLSKTVLINQFSFLEQLNNGVNIYYAQIPLGELNGYEAICQASGGSTNSVLVPVTIDLLDDSGMPYPICDYTGFGDLFACNAFAATSAYCEVPGGDGTVITGTGNCDSNELANISAVLTYYCGPCGNDDPDDGFRNDVNLDQEVYFSTVSILPNPFQDNLEINWPNIAVEEILVLDVTGRVIQRQNIRTDAPNSIVLNTTQFSSGVYFVQLRNNKTSKVFKLIKQ